MDSDQHENNLNSSLGHNLHRMGQLAREETNKALKAHGITPEQWQILIALMKNDGITPTELGELTLRDKTTISRILPALFVKGIIEKKVNARDARSYVIKLNEQYRELALQLLGEVKNHFQVSVFPVISQEEQTILLQIILKLRRGLGDIK